MCAFSENHIVVICTNGVVLKFDGIYDNNPKQVLQMDSRTMGQATCLL